MYYIKRLLALLLFLIYHSFVVNFIRNLCYKIPVFGGGSGSAALLSAGLMGILYIVGGVMLGWIISDNVRLKFSSGDSVYITTLLLIPFFIILFKQGGICLPMIPDFVDNAIAKTTPILQNFLGIWLFLLFRNKRKSGGRRY
ncbi:MAG: hypothetical protein ACOX4U_03440 [Anaerovoracaceae bacterium]|jgi:hypothetical protein